MARKLVYISLFMRFQPILLTTFDLNPYYETRRKIKKYFLYTDGGCYPNPGGNWGWAFILEQGDKEVERNSGCGVNGTNNIAELTAAIKGLQHTPVGATITIVSDSQYVLKGLSEWRAGWKKRGWAGIANRALWIELDGLANERDVSVEWIRGHVGHPQNEECDEMATKAYRS